MAKNKLTDLNDHLFAQLERLGEEDLTDAQLAKEVVRAKAINVIASNVINNARTVLDGIKFSMNELPANMDMPEQFKLKPKE